MSYRENNLLKMQRKDRSRPTGHAGRGSKKKIILKNKLHAMLILMFENIFFRKIV